MNGIRKLTKGTVALAVFAVVSVGAIPAAFAGPGNPAGGKGISNTAGSGDPGLALAILGALVVLMAAFAGVKAYLRRPRPAFAV